MLEIFKVVALIDVNLIVQVSCTDTLIVRPLKLPTALLLLNNGAQALVGFNVIDVQVWLLRSIFGACVLFPRAQDGPFRREVKVKSFGLCNLKDLFERRQRNNLHHLFVGPG
uniref:Uncharacterized protein n=1 Tax=Ixodes ricinus TaxID=34613 RepID=A0A6B0UJY8_IXORI